MLVFECRPFNTRKLVAALSQSAIFRFNFRSRYRQRLITRRKYFPPLGKDLFQCRLNDEADYHQQHPGTDLGGTDDGPLPLLVWILPRSKIGGDIFCHPDEEADQKKRKRR